MAAAFPVKNDRALSGGHASLALIGAGPFGERVAGHLLSACPGARMVAATDICNAFAVARDAVVVALWRPEPALCERADELSYRYGLPWLPVTMEHPVIRVGPMVCPQSGPCFRCYRRRREQHDTQPAVTVALLAAYAGEPAAGPGGYLPHHARIAAGVARQMLQGFAPSEPSRRNRATAGQVTTIRLLGAGISVNPVIACHDCGRCGGPPGPAGDLDVVLAQVQAAGSRAVPHQGVPAVQGAAL